MQEYLLLISQNEATHAQTTAAQRAALMEARAGFRKRLEAAGAFADAERLRPSREGKKVSRTKTGPLVEDGPFAVDGQTLAGYYFVRAADLDAAVALGKDCPLGAGETLDVRPVMGAHMQPDKTSKPGRVFAFAVLGQADTEEAWVHLMDRIEADTKDGFPHESFEGGLRLEAPSAGRRISRKGDVPMVSDGPFLESKEVIGGMFFVRLPSLDEAARWACDTAFLRHGSLEIREVWRG